MITLQIVSYELCGKTALCAGIGKKLINTGKKVGYIKPIHLTGKDNPGSCSDAFFVREALELSEKNEQICPLHISQEELWRNLSEGADNFNRKIAVVCDAVSGGKDILIIESPGNLKSDQVSELACFTIAEQMNSRVIMLVSYATDFKEKAILETSGKYGDKLIGIVINQVPEIRLDAVQKEANGYFQANGLMLLGILPEARTLSGVSVSELATAVEGEIISSADKAGELVENVMLGAMSPDSARDYYSGKKNKVVVTRAERADMQLAALETSTRCLIVTGEKPSASVMLKAGDKNVPVILVKKDIKEVIGGIERTLKQARFQHTQKLQAISALLDGHFDYRAFNTAVGI